MLDVRKLQGADCDTEHYLVVEKVRERLAVSEQKRISCTVVGIQDGGERESSATELCPWRKVDFACESSENGNVKMDSGVGMIIDIRL
jgi:hypothetical protein